LRTVQVYVPILRGAVPVAGSAVPRAPATTVVRVPAEPGLTDPSTAPRQPRRGMAPEHRARWWAVAERLPPGPLHRCPQPVSSR